MPAWQGWQRRRRPRHQACCPPLRSLLRRGPTCRGARGRRPWEAPEALLADAGVELGVNYPLPLVTPAESRAALARAAAVIEQAMAWPAGDKAPYRPASVPSQRPSAATPTASSVPQDDAERGAPPARAAGARRQCRRVRQRRALRARAERGHRACGAAGPRAPARAPGQAGAAGGRRGRGAGAQAARRAG